MEIWKNIKGYEWYKVSNYGNVMSIDRIVIYCNGKKHLHKGKELKKQKQHNGYLQVKLRSNGKRKGFSIHKLVAQVYILNTDNKSCVNHIDGDKLNNRVENLEWCTYSENAKHSYNILGKIPWNKKLKKEL